jgi:hypothetical protein
MRQPQINNQSMKMTSPSAVMTTQSRLVLGHRYGCSGVTIQPSPSMMRITPNHLGM